MMNYNQSVLQNSIEIILIYSITIVGNVCYLLLFSLQIYQIVIVLREMQIHSPSKFETREVFQFHSSSPLSYNFINFWIT